jgi:putative inorganic carbon (HCO3(-)) transporter
MSALARGAAGPGALMEGVLILSAALACAALISFFTQALPALLVLCGIAAFAFVVARPDLGLCLLAFISYLNLSDAIIESFNAPSIAKFTVVGVLLAVLVRWGLFRTRLGGTPLSYLAIAAVWLLGASSVLYAAHPDESLDAFERLSKDVLFAVIILMVVMDGTMLRRLVWSLISAGAIMSAITVYQALTGSFDDSFFGLGKAEIHQIVGDISDHRPGGPLGDPNMYAQVLVLIVPLTAERTVNGENLLARLVAGATSVLCTLAIIFTYSRGGLLALLVVWAVLALPLVRRPRVALLVIVLAGFVASFVPSSYIDRLTKLEVAALAASGGSEDVSLEGRTAEMLVAWRMFLDHPVLGVGLENYPRHFQPYVQKLGLRARHEDRKSHSLYLQIAAERGALGILAFTVLLVVTLRGLLAGRRELLTHGYSAEASIAAAAAVSLLGYGVAAIFLHGEYGRYFWIMIGIAMSIRTISKGELPSREQRGPAGERQ